MKVIIAGSRGIKNLSTVMVAMEIAATQGIVPTEVICGGAQGVDKLGDAWASIKGLPVVYMPAQWDVYGRAAGPIRNKAMATLGDALVAVWDGKSRGTLDMISKARALGLKVYIHNV